MTPETRPPAPACEAHITIRHMQCDLTDRTICRRSRNSGHVGAPFAVREANIANTFLSSDSRFSPPPPSHAGASGPPSQRVQTLSQPRTGTR